jgi:hypothetical protein
VDGRARRKQGGQELIGAQHAGGVPGGDLVGSGAGDVPSQ